MTLRDPLSIWVVMPVYNGSRHLAEQLESIARQDRAPDGLVACDDGSTDNSLAVLQDFAKTAEFPVTVVRQPQNVGLLSNLETALSHALPKADVIVFSDQDDMWVPRKLTSIEQAFSDPDALLWYSDAELVDSKGAPFGSRMWQGQALSEGSDLNDERHLMRFVEGVTMAGSAMAVRSSLVRAALPFPRTQGSSGHMHFLHDGWLGLLAHLLDGIVLQPDALTLYRQHEHQYTSMSILRAVEAGAPRRRRSLARQRILDEEARLRSVIQHLERPQSLAVLGGTLPPVLADRAAYLAVRCAVITGDASPLGLWRLRDQYRRYGAGWRAIAADLARHAHSMATGSKSHRRRNVSPS